MFSALRRSTASASLILSSRDALAPGESVQITMRDGRRACNYDMRFEFQGDDLEDMEDTQDLCNMSEYEITE